MLAHNQTVKRCLILSRNQQTLEVVNSILSASGFHVDNIFERKAAMKCFFQYHHDLFFIDEIFIPKYPHRLLQFFKMAHKTPGVVIFTENKNIISFFDHFKNDVPIRISSPYEEKKIKEAIDSVFSVLNGTIKRYFRKDFLIQTGIAIPLVILTIYLIVKNFIE